VLSRRARKKMQLSVTYRSHLNLNQPALRTKLRARVTEILQENKPKVIRGACYEHYEGEIELAGVVHSFTLTFDGHDTRLFVLEGSYDDFDALHDAIDAALEPDEPRGYYFDEVDQISP
jgi:hypothetical protein